jgi:hypothetical protein
MSSQNVNLIPAVKRLTEEYVKSVYGVSLDTLVDCYNENGRSTHKIEDEINASTGIVKEILIKNQKSDDPENMLTNAFLKTASEKKKVSVKDKAKCIHPIAKGEKKGQPCGTSVCDESKSGKYCKKHLAQEGKENETPAAPKTAAKTSVAATKKSKEEQPLNKFTKEELKEKIEKRTTEIEVRRNKFGNWEHQGSGILIDRDTRKAYGKQNNDGSVSPLTSEDICLCKTVGFKYLLPDNISSNDNDDNEEEEDEDEDLDIDEDIDDEDMEE